MSIHSRVLVYGRCPVYCRVVAAPCTMCCRVVAAQCTGVWLLLSVVTAQCSRSFPIFCVGDVTPVVWLFQSNGHKTHRLVRPFQSTSALKGRAWKQTVELFEKVRVHVGCRM